MSLDKYHEINISAFHIPFLRDLGIKVVSMITFDLMYGPICYIRELSRSNFGDRLKDVDKLAEIYAGFARTEFDVITSMDEKIVVSNYVEKTEETEISTILLFVCVATADVDKLTKYARSLSERTKGDPTQFNSALKQLIENEKKSAHKVMVSQKNNMIKGLTINEETVVSGSDFNNFHGFLFINYRQADIDGRFIPKLVDGKKIDIRALVKFVDIQKNEAELSAGELITLYYRGMELLVFTHALDAIMIAIKKSRSQINYSFLNKWFLHFFDTYIRTPGETLKVSTLETLSYLDKKISGEPRRFVISEFMDLMINAEKDFPELPVLSIVIKQQGWITLKKDYELFLENLKMFSGDRSIYQISQDMSLPLSKVVDFIIFLKSRNLIEVYRKR